MSRKRNNPRATAYEGVRSLDIANSKRRNLLAYSIRQLRCTPGKSIHSNALSTQATENQNSWLNPTRTHSARQRRLGQHTPKRTAWTVTCETLTLTLTRSRERLSEFSIIRSENGVGAGCGDRSGHAPACPLASWFGASDVPGLLRRASIIAPDLGDNFRRPVVSFLSLCMHSQERTSYECICEPPRRKR